MANLTRFSLLFTLLACIAFTSGCTLTGQSTERDSRMWHKQGYPGHGGYGP